MQGLILAGSMHWSYIRNCSLTNYLSLVYVSFSNPETYLKSCQTSIVELFCENSLRLNASVFAKKIHHGYLTGYFTKIPPYFSKEREAVRKWFSLFFRLSTWIWTFLLFSPNSWSSYGRVPPKHIIPGKILDVFWRFLCSVIGIYSVYGVEF